MPEFTIEAITRIAETIQGTCKSLDQVLQEEFGDDSLTIEQVPIALLYHLDSITMECQTCNWWCEAGEIDEDGNCDYCRG